MSDQSRGFSLLELLIVIIVLGIIAAFAIPQAYNAIKAYRVNSDATAIATQLNVARFRATSQLYPYRVHLSTASNTFYLERLCGGTSSSKDASCTGPYQSYTGQQYTDSSGNVVSAIEGGRQYLSTQDIFTLTNPGTSCPPPAPLSFAACSGASGTATDFYFNTRGMPVDSSGNPISGGGEVIYLTGPTQLTDAVTVSVGGLIGTYNWDVVNSRWYSR